MPWVRLGSLGLVVAMCAFSLAQDDKAVETNVGLTGILEDQVPRGLSKLDFEDLASELPESWNAWTVDTANRLESLYEGDHKTIEDQRQALRLVKEKVNTLRKSLSDSRYRSIHDQIEPLYQDLSIRVQLAEAAMDTVTLDPVKLLDQRQRSAYSELRNSVSSLRSDMNRVKGGQEWLKWIDANGLANLRSNDAGAIEAVVDAKNRLESREGFDDDIKKFLSRESFLKLEDALDAILGVNKLMASDDPNVVQEPLANLIDAVIDYEDSPSTEKLNAIQDAMAEVKAVSLDGGARMQATLNGLYTGDNLRMSISEGLLNRFISDSRQDSSWINECILEAHVTGYQCTNSNIWVDIQPNNYNASFLLCVDGNVNANTNGAVSVANVHSVGYHTFNVSKKVNFDGHNFSFEPTRVGANANTQIVSAVTKFSRIPILGRIADNIAYEKALEKRGQANAAARQKIMSQASSQLDSQVSEKFSKATYELEANRYGPLRENGLFPQQLSLSSTSSEINVRSRLMEPGEVGGRTPIRGTAMPTAGMMFQFHESLLTNGSERLDLAGKEMTKEELTTYLEGRFQKILNKPDFKIPEPEATPTEDGEDAQTEASTDKLVFADEDALRFSIADGEIMLIMRAGLKREGKEDIPTVSVFVPLIPALENDKLLLEIGRVRARSGRGAQNAIMGRQIQDALSDAELETSMTFDVDGRSVKLTMTDLIVGEGWVSVTLH